MDPALKRRWIKKQKMLQAFLASQHNKKNKLAANENLDVVTE